MLSSPNFTWTYTWPLGSHPNFFLAPPPPHFLGGHFLVFYFNPLYLQNGLSYRVETGTHVWGQLGDTPQKKFGGRGTPPKKQKKQNLCLGGRAKKNYVGGCPPTGPTRGYLSRPYGSNRLADINYWKKSTYFLGGGGGCPQLSLQVGTSLDPMAQTVWQILRIEI